MINKGAKLNVRNIIAKTPLHYAMELKDKEFAMLLIESGANYNLPDRDGITALDLARKDGNEEIYDLIMKKEEEKKQEIINTRNKYIKELKEKIDTDTNLKYKFSDKTIQTYVDLKMELDLDIENLEYDEVENLLQLYNYNKEEVKEKNDKPITKEEITRLENNTPIYIRGVADITGLVTNRVRQYLKHNETGGKLEIRKIAREEGKATLTKLKGAKTGNYKRCVSMANFGKVKPYKTVGYGIIKQNTEGIHLASKYDMHSMIDKSSDMIYRRDMKDNDRENMPIEQRLDGIFEYLRTESDGETHNEVIMDVANKDVKFIYWCQKDRTTQRGQKEEDSIFDKLQAVYLKKKYYEQTGRTLPIFEYRINEKDYLVETNFTNKEIVDMLKKEIFDKDGKTLSPKYNNESAIDFLMAFNDEISLIPGHKEILEKFIEDRIDEYSGNNINSIYDVINIAKYAGMLKGEEYQQECIKKTFNNILDLTTITNLALRKSSFNFYTRGKRKSDNKDIALVVEILSEIRKLATDETMEFLKPKLEEVTREIKYTYSNNGTKLKLRDIWREIVKAFEFEEKEQIKDLREHKEKIQVKTGSLEEVRGKGRNLLEKTMFSKDNNESKPEKLTKEQIKDLREHKEKIQVKTGSLEEVREKGRNLLEKTMFSKDNNESKPEELTKEQIEDLRENKEKIQIKREPQKQLKKDVRRDSLV